LPVKVAVVTAVVILVLDQVTKYLALAHLPPAAPISIVDGFFSLTLLSIGALAVLGVVGFRLLPTGGALSGLALGLVFGGAVGNLIDRARFGAVVDFLDFYWRDYHWPAFNVADSAISVGVVLLVFDILRHPHGEPASEARLNAASSGRSD
jgi:signal peptidase II